MDLKVQWHVLAAWIRITRRDPTMNKTLRRGWIRTLAAVTILITVAATPLVVVPAQAVVTPTGSIPLPPPSCAAHAAPTYDATTGTGSGPRWPEPDFRVCAEHDASLGVITASPTSANLGDSVTLTFPGTQCNPGDFRQLGCFDVFWDGGETSRWYDVQAQTMIPDSSVILHSTCHNRDQLSCVVPLV